MNQKFMMIIIFTIVLVGCTSNTPTPVELKPEIIVPSGENEENELIVIGKENTIHPLPITEETISSFTTTILTKDPDRYHNIQLVTDKLSGYVLQNGQTFSFNEACGPFGPEEGYKKASILLSDGTHEEGYGGGVCQLSSTLYNAIKDLKVDIIEQHHHSAPVGYVPENQDATVSISSGLDFRFINQMGFPIRLMAELHEKELTVRIIKL